MQTAPPGASYRAERKTEMKQVMNTIEIDFSHVVGDTVGWFSVGVGVRDTSGEPVTPKNSNYECLPQGLSGVGRKEYEKVIDQVLESVKDTLLHIYVHDRYLAE